MGIRLTPQVILAAPETEYGVEVVPDPNDDALHVANFAWSDLELDHLNPNEFEDDPTPTGLPAEPSLPGGRRASITIRWKAHGPGIAYADTVTGLPEADALLRGSRLQRNDNFPDDVTYVHQKTGTLGSYTLYVYAAGLLVRMVGCRSNLTWTFEPGGRCEFSFEIQGLVLTNITEVAAPTIPAQAAPAQPVQAIAMTIGGVALSIERGELTLGNEVVEQTSVNAAEAIEEYDIPFVRPMLSLTAKRALLATYNPWDDHRTRTPRAIASAVGGTALNVINLSITKAWVRDPRPVEVQRIAGYELEFLIADEVTANDPLAIQFA